MPCSEPEPLEDVLLRLEGVYASSQDPCERDAASYGNRGSISPSQDELTRPMLPCLVAVCLLPRNHPDDFGRLFRYFADHTSLHRPLDPAALALRLRTALFKCAPLVGVPLVANALQALHESIVAHPNGEQILADLPKESSKPTKTAEADAKAGWAFFEAIYERHATKIIEKIGMTCPDLSEMSKSIQVTCF